MTSNEIFSRIEEKVKEAMDLLSEGFDNSLIILRFFRWSKKRIENEYFNDCEKYLEDFGIKIKVNLEKKKKMKSKWRKKYALFALFVLKMRN